MSGRELEKDKKQWFSFVEGYRKRAESLGIRALMVVPYGEAMIHTWYWEGLAQISGLPETDAVGVQTNLSFPVKKFLETFAMAGGKMEKIRLWATFHPEMTDVEEFAGRCRELGNAGVTLCAGAVGVPENIELLRRLRKELPEEIYLWINAMDGLGRPYTPQEQKAFRELDPYFIRELVPVPADVSMCRDRLFVEGDGRVHICNISRVQNESWEEISFPWEKGICGRKRCSCYLAYGGREDFMNRILFGPYPLFRIPRRPKAVFLDIEGTLIPEQNRRLYSGLSQKNAHRSEQPCTISEDVMAGLEALAEDGSKLFFATTLPYEEAMKRCRGIGHLFAGGVFAGGAHLVLEQGETKRELFHYLDEAGIFALAGQKEKYHFRILTCREKEKIYKITLLRPAGKPWEIREAEELFRDSLFLRDTMRYYIEGNCLQIVAAKADKAGGVETLCRWLPVSPKDAAAAGDSEEDAGMLELCGIL